MSEFTHINEQGNAKMVDVSEKNITKRTAIAHSSITVNQAIYQQIVDNTNKKGKNSNKHEEKRRPKSKFSAKYSERIKSIKEADEKFNKKASQRKTKQASPKSKKSKTEIRNEMMKQLKNSKLKDD